MLYINDGSAFERWERAPNFGEQKRRRLVAVEEEGLGQELHTGESECDCVCVRHIHFSRIFSLFALKKESIERVFGLYKKKDNNCLINSHNKLTGTVKRNNNVNILLGPEGRV